MVAGLLAGAAFALAAGVVWPAAGRAAPHASGALDPVGRQAADAVQCEEQAAGLAAANGASAINAERGVPLSMFFPFLHRGWPSLVELGSEVARMDAAIERALSEMWAGRQRPIDLALALGRVAAWPRVALRETADAYDLEVNAPGVDPSEVKVDVQGQQVTVRYDNEHTTLPAAPAGTVRGAASFEETFRLAHAVDAAHMRIDRHRELLEVTLPKAQHDS